MHIPAVRFHNIPANNILRGPVAPLYQDIRFDCGNCVIGVRLIKQNDIVNKTERREYLCPLSFRYDRTLVPLDSLYRGITV